MFITEIVKDNPKYYRAGPVQNIKKFKPKKPDTAHKDDFELPVTYATDDITYAAAFCFDWSDEDGFELSQIDEDWMLFIPKKYKSNLDSACSMYTISGDFTRIEDITTPEYLSTTIAKVIHERQFDTAWDCLQQYNVKIRIR